MADHTMPRPYPRRCRARGVALVGAGALLVNSACYSYLPPPGGTLPADSEVQVELTADGSAQLQPVVGPRIRIVEGRVRAIDADGNPTIDIEQLTSWDGAVAPFTGRDAVRVPRAAIARAAVRTLDRKRSWTVAGVMGGVFLAAVITALAKARSRASGNPGRIGGSPPDLRAP